MHRLALLTVLVLIGCVPPIQERPQPHFIDLTHIEDSIAIDMRYAGENNFVGERIDGYRAPRCLLTDNAASALAQVQRELMIAGFSLIVHDCYRPQRAVDHFAQWALDLSDERTKSQFYPNIPKSRLFALGYIAEQSSHSRGSTVDVTIIEHHSNGRWALIDMGTDYDFFDPASHTETDLITSAQQQNRLLLHDAMTRGGFENFPKEWWHYTFRNEPYPHDYWDVLIR